MATRQQRFSNTWHCIMSFALLWIALCFGTAWAAPYAYIIDKTSVLDIIDTASNTFIKRVSSNGLDPYSVAVNPNGTRVYVTENNSSSLSVLDALGSPVKSVPVSANPQKVIVHPNGKRVYVSYRYSAQGFVSIIDADTNTVMADKLNPPPCTGTPCSLSIWDIALSPNGTRLYAVVSYIGSPNAYKLVAFDTSSFQVLATIDLSSYGYINSIALNSTGTRIYASQSTGNYPSIKYNVSVIDATNLQVITSKLLGVATKIISAVGTEIITSPDDTKVYVNTGDISIMNTSTYAVTTVPISFDPNATNVVGHMAMNPDGKRIYVTGFYSLNPPYNNYAYLDTASNTLVKTSAQVPICTDARACFDPSGIAIGPANIATPYALSISNNGNGTITSNPVGINCGTTCSANFNLGTSVTLTATPATGYSFSAWGGACSGTGACVVTMNSAQSVTATFIVVKANQTISFGTAPAVVFGGSGMVSATGGGSGNPVVFSSSTTGICSTSGTNGSTVTGLAAGNCVIAANQAGNANYNAAPQVTQTISISKANQTIAFKAAPSVFVGGTGTVSATGGGSGNPVSFTSQTKAVCTVSGNTVTGVAAGACTIAADQAGNDNYNAATLATQTLTVTSQPVALTVINANPTGGTVTSADSGINCGATCSANYTQNQIVTLTATPKQGYVFAGWSGGGCSGTASCVVTMAAATTITAQFNPGPWLSVVMDYLLED